MLYFGGIIFFMFGLLVGSFLNVVIFRTEKDEEFIKKPSHCPYCGELLKWYELFPLFSYAAQKGKCRHCGRDISPQYFLVELLCGLGFAFLFTILFRQYGGNAAQLTVELLFWTALYSFFLLIFVYDLKHKIIPDQFLIPAAFVMFFYQFQKDVFNHCSFFTHSHIVSGLFGAAAGAFFFWLLFYLSKGAWMGFGDVKLAMLLGFLLGPSAMAVAMLAAFFAGSAIGLLLVTFSGLHMKSQIPFGPFMIFGGLLSFFYAPQLIAAYLGVINEINVYLWYRLL